MKKQLEEAIESVDLGGEGFETVSRKTTKYDFPVASVNKHGLIIFNTLAAQHVPDRFTWRFNDKWAVLDRCYSSGRAYRSTPYQSTTGKFCSQCRIPRNFALEGGIMEGTHKVYKTKNGIAIMRFEVLET